MTSSIYPWQNEAWVRLQGLRARLPHAILFHGPQGIGKTTFAEHFAQALLCETPVQDGHPCGQCSSCGWFIQYGHPDFRRVRPEVLEDELAGDEAGEGDGKKGAKASRTPSKEIKIDQVRALSDFMNVSTHRQGVRVVVLYPAEALNMAAANALLKTLEEPPPQTIFLLVTNSIDRLLPTILSRCRKFALPMPAFDDALHWLQTQDLSDADMWLAEQGGAPLAAQAVAHGESREVMDSLLKALAQPSTEAVLKTAERLQKASVPELVSCLQRWQYDVFSYKLCGRIRYYPRYAKELAALAARTNTSRLLQGLKVTNERKAIAEHPLSPKLFIEDMLLDYASLYS